MRITQMSAALLCAIGLILAGCSRSPQTPGTAGDDNLVRRGNVEQPETLDPASANDIHTFNILYDLYEGLVTLDAHGKIVSGVAQSWTVSDDGLTYTFELRPDARWSNGAPVTADDFVRGFRRAAAPSTISEYASLLSPITNFNSVKDGAVASDMLGIKATGDRALEIKLSHPSPQLLGVITMPIAFPLYADGSASGQFGDPDKFVGNGAYVLDHWTIGDPIRLQRNSEYWDAENVDIDSVEYYAISDEITEFNMYRTGALDITATLPTNYIDQVKESRAEEVRIAPSLALYYLAFDLTEPPLDEPAIREALSISIDREQLAKTLGRGEQPAYSVVPPGVSNHRSTQYSWRDSDTEENIELAKKLLADSGYGVDNPLELTLLYDAGGIHETVALIISSMWSESLGIKVELDKREWKYFLDTRDVREEWTVMRFSWFGDYDDPSTFTDIFHSDSPQNLPRYESDEYDQLVESAAMEIDLADRAEILKEAESVLLEDYPIAPIYFFVSKHMVKPDISGFEDNVLDRHPSKYLRR